MKFSLAALLLAGASLVSASTHGTAHDALAKRDHTLEKRTMSWGSLNLTRAYTVEYTEAHWKKVAQADGYANATTAFCTNLHFVAVQYAESGSLDEHHVMDCVPSQEGPTIFAFVGGVSRPSFARATPPTPVALARLTRTPFRPLPQLHFLQQMKKRSNGTWSSKERVYDNLRAAIAYARSIDAHEVYATIKKTPIGRKKCLAYKAKHPNKGYVC